MKEYNKLIKLYRKNFVEYLTENLESDQTFDKIINSYLDKLNPLISDEKEKSSKLNGAYALFTHRNKYHRRKATLHIINDEILKSFDNRAKGESEINKFKNFCISLSKYAVYNDLQDQIITEFNEIEKKFNIKDTSKLLSFCKDDVGLYQFKKLDQNDVMNISPNKSKKLTTRDHKNPFTDDEKIIMLHYLFKHKQHKTEKLSTYEIVLILKLTCDSFINLKLDKSKDTIYNKFSQGYGYYQKTDKVKKDNFLNLINKCKDFELNKFINYLHSELYKF